MHGIFIHAVLKRNDLLKENAKQQRGVSMEGVKKKAAVQLEIPTYGKEGEQRLLKSMTDIANFKGGFKEPDKTKEV